MALLQEDFEPPLSEDNQKTKILSQNSSKIKNHFSNIFSKLASAIFLLGNYIKKILIYLGNFRLNFVNSALPIFGLTRKYLPHIAIGFITFVVVVSNFVIRYAEGHVNDFLVVEPGNEINLARDAEKYTPILKDAASSVEIAYAAPADEFAQTTTTVATVYTVREEPLPDNSSSSVYYTVRDGDTLTVLGWKFNVKIATLQYVNDLDTVDLIKPGQQLKIPQSGYEVSASAIAQRQKEKLAAANKTTSKSSSSSKSISVNLAAGSRNNGYPYGYCTYYVATKRAVPSSMGNAKNWLGSARANGMGTGSSPAVGAIVVTNESWWGHVAYVEDVSDGYITVSEMNYNGWGVVNRRTLPASSGVIRGYIY